MKKSGLLNVDLNAALARQGHGDLIVIADAGLPVPPGVPSIDLAVTLGVPRFAEVLDAVLAEMVVEQAFAAEEATGDMRDLLAARGVTTWMPHEEFKTRTAQARCIVRTGEATPYANIGLISGVPF
ncbi:MAG: D-ribose pyranase [Pseudomonadota bacterium]